MILRGKEAEIFLRQVRYGRPNKRAKAALAQGLKLLAEIKRNGFARIQPTR